VQEENPEMHLETLGEEGILVGQIELSEVFKESE